VAAPSSLENSENRIKIP